MTLHSFLNEILTSEIFTFATMKMISHLDQGWLFIGRFKVGSVPRTRNKESHERKGYLPKKKLKFITLCMLKKEGE